MVGKDNCDETIRRKLKFVEREVKVCSAITRGAENCGSQLTTASTLADHLSLPHHHHVQHAWIRMKPWLCNPQQRGSHTFEVTWAQTFVIYAATCME